MAQDDLQRECEDEVAWIDAEVRRLTEGRPEDQLRWNPSDGCWSISQVFDHLTAANGSYFGPVRGAIDRAQALGKVRRAQRWKPSFFGAMLVRSLQPSTTRGLPSPKMWRPGSSQRPGAVQAFLATQTTLAELLREARGIDLLETRLSSPVSRFIRLNLGDAFKVLTVHSRRHLGQVERILARDAFPHR